MKIVYTYTDEAPALATHSLLPVVRGVRRRGGRRDRAARHLARRADPRRVRARRRRARRARRAGEDAGGEHHQAAEHQRVAAAAEGGDQGAAGRRLRPCPDRTRTRREAYDTVKGSAVNPVLREGNSDRRAPASVKAFAREAPALDGRVVAATRRRHVATMGDGDFRSHRAVGHDRRRRRAADRARRRRRDGHRAQGGRAGAGGRDRRRGRHAPPRARRVPRRADRRREGAGRAVLTAPEGDDDEGLGPDHLRPRRAGVLRRRLRASTATQLDARRREPEQRAGERADRDREAARTTSATAIEDAIERTYARRPRGSRWSTPTAGSPTCTSRAT